MSIRQMCLTTIAETARLPDMANMNLMSSREACEALGIKRSTLTYWMLTGRITPAQTIPGPNRAASHLFSSSDVERLAVERAS